MALLRYYVAVELDSRRTLDLRTKWVRGPSELCRIRGKVLPKAGRIGKYSLIFNTMGSTKKRTTASSPKTRSPSSKQVSLKKVKGENFYRNAKQVGRARMLTGGKAVRDKDGNIVKAAAFQKGESEAKPGRVQPDRRWFGTF